MAIEIPGPPPRQSADVTESWAHYLDPGETLLWEGAPAAGLRFRGSDIVVSLFGCAFTGFAIVWMVTAASATAGTEIGLWFPLAGLPFVLVGGFLLLGRFFWRAHVRRHTRYALTDRRAIIATSAFGRSLKSYPIDEDTRLEYRPGPESTIWFAKEVKRSTKGRRYTVRHGFDYIADGDEVYRLIREVQQRDRVRESGGA